MHSIMVSFHRFPKSISCYICAQANLSSDTAQSNFILF
uniref:Uncharacterized protein n=1 Tax=Arundo donax TaxID=35708 RepID=A0A0A9GRI0_ARUDO